MIKAIIFDFFGVIETGQTLNQSLLELIQNRLKPQYKIALMSNSSGKGATELLGDSAQLFDELIFSGQVGVSKPQPAIFQLALEKLGAKPEQSIFVDDSQSYCQQASALSLKAIYYQGFEQFKTDLGQLLAAESSDN